MMLEQKKERKDVAYTENSSSARAKTGKFAAEKWTQSCSYLIYQRAWKSGK